MAAKAIKQLLKTIERLNLKKWVDLKVNDLRDNRGKKYAMTEAILSVVLMFILKEGSRHSYNQDRAEPKFAANIHKLLNINLLHGDSFNDILSVISEDDLQELKACLIKSLIREGIVSPDRLTGKFTIAVDATGTHAYEDDYSGSCLYKTSKNGVVSYSHAVLEAKLVNEDGFCLSLASEWIENESKGFEKQDCESKAFKRLALKINKLYPDLPILLVADGLYCTAPVIEIASTHNWDYLLVLKDGSQKDLNEEIVLRPDKKTTLIGHKKAHYLNDLELGKTKVSWLKWEESGNQFSWITNLEIKGFEMVSLLQKIGRRRWVIENEGFNTQKNLGYGLQHKYSRVCYKAIQNYYQCLQIAHLIEQVYLLTSALKVGIQRSKVTIIKLCERLRNLLVFMLIPPQNTSNKALNETLLE